MSDKTASSERQLQGLKRAKSLLAETLLGFDDAEENYGYDMANERYFVREAINEIDAKANEPDEDARGVSELKHLVRLLKERKEEINKMWTKTFEDRDMEAESTYKELFNSYCNVIGDLINKEAA